MYKAKQSKAATASLAALCVSIALLSNAAQAMTGCEEFDDDENLSTSTPSDTSQNNLNLVCTKLFTQDFTFCKGTGTVINVKGVIIAKFPGNYLSCSGTYICECP